MAKNRERGALLTDAEVCDLLKVEGVEIWAKPYDDRPVMLTFGTLKRILARALRVEAASGAVADGALSDDDMHRLHDQSQMGWGHDWRKFGRLVEAAALSRASSSRDEGEYRAMVAVMERIDPANFPGLTAEERCALGRFAKPQSASPSRAEAERDAERLDWLLRFISGAEIRRLVGPLNWTGDNSEFRAAIDAAILAAAEAPKENGDG